MIASAPAAAHWLRLLQMLPIMSLPSSTVANLNLRLAISMLKFLCVCMCARVIEVGGSLGGRRTTLVIACACRTGSNS